MSQNFQPGDFLVFQLESGFALLRVLAVQISQSDTTWHIVAFDDFYLDVEQAEAAIAGGNLKVSHRHLALTNRAFESTQMAKLLNVPLADEDLAALNQWREDPESEVSDRSVRLMLGFR